MGNRPAAATYGGWPAAGCAIYNLQMGERGLGLATKTWGTGDGPNVLLVHGLSGTANSWWSIASDLVGLGCVVTAPDLRGHGQSPTAASYGFEEHAEDLRVLGGQWELAVGHSLAGPILASTAQSAGLIANLLLLDPVFEIPEDDFDAVVQDQLSEVGALVTQTSIAESNPSWHPEDCFHKAAGAQATSPFVIERCLRDNAPFDHLGRLRDLKMPVEILAADPTVGTMAPASIFTKLGMSNVSHLVLPGLSHGLHRERPDLVVDKAKRMLELGGESEPPG